MTRLAVEVVNGNPAERILVIARTYGQFNHWCRENEINPHAANVKWIARDEHLRGYRNAWYVLLGYPDGWDGYRLHDLFEHMKATRGFRNAETVKEEPPDGS